MSEPIFDQTTEDIYGRLPEHFRSSDSNQNWTLKKLIQSIGSQQDDVTQLIQRFDYTPPEDGGDPNDTSELVDPQYADEAWLPWLAQVLGVRLSSSFIDSSTRNEIINSSTGYKAGTDEAIIAAVRTELVGSKSVTLKKRMTDTVAGSEWDLLILTLSSETLQNILPSNIIVPSSVRNWTVVSEPTGDTSRVLLHIMKDTDFYKDRALQFSADEGSGTEPTEYHLYTPHYFPLDGSDPLTTMVDICYESGTNSTITVSGGIDLYQESGGVYTNLASPVMSAEDTIAVGQTKTFLGRDTSIHADATHGRFMIILKNIGTDALVHMGHFGARKEEDTTWVHRTADPVQAVIDRGAKPAGIQLWHALTSSTWDDLEDGETTTWDDLEALPDWTAVEEYDG